MYKLLCFDFWILSGQDFITFQINSILTDLHFGSAINNYHWPIVPSSFMLPKVVCRDKKGNMNISNFITKLNPDKKKKPLFSKENNVF